MSKKSQIRQPGDVDPIQLALFAPPGVEVDDVSDWPRIDNTEAGFLRALREAESTGLLGLDYEFKSPTKPTVIGVASRVSCSALEYTRGLNAKVEAFVKAGGRLIAHSGIGADKPVYDAAVGYDSPLEIWEDSMIVHWFENSDLCKAPSKDASDDAGSFGFMDLWSAASLVEDVPCWKRCRGSACSGPCPRHDVFSYCAIDAWAGVVIYEKNWAKLKARGFKPEVYDLRRYIAGWGQKRQEAGVRIDTAHVARVVAAGEEARLGMFPEDEAGQRQPFNPRSQPQVLAWFAERGLRLPSNSKIDVMKVLEKEAAKLGYLSIDDLDGAEDDLPETVKALKTLFDFKSTGKGIDAWFGEKYVKDGYAHPRFVSTGSSMGRLSSVGPNFQNIPVRGAWAAEIKKAVIGEDGEDVIDADLGQLELRNCLYAAGVDVSTIMQDAFLWLVEQAGGKFKRASGVMKGDERDVAKSLGHGSNYLEGIQIYTPLDMGTPRFKKELEAGAIRLYTRKYYPRLPRDWEYGGGVVGFNGGNLAERLFGSKTVQNRALALGLLEDLYFETFWRLRLWHIKLLEEIESRGYVQLPSSRFLRMSGTPRDNAKNAAALVGQGTGADYAQEGLRAVMEASGRLTLLQVHDSQVATIPSEWSDTKVREYIAPMFAESKLMPGFRAPGKVKRGKNYGSYHPTNNPFGLKEIWNSAKDPIPY